MVLKYNLSEGEKAQETNKEKARMVERMVKHVHHKQST